jgi:hypothetical protein
VQDRILALYAQAQELTDAMAARLPHLVRFVAFAPPGLVGLRPRNQ